MSIVWVPKLFAAGRNPGPMFGNLRDASFQAASSVATYVNMCAGMRRKLLFAKSIPLNESTGSGGAVTSSFCKFHTSPSASLVRVSMVLLPADSTSAALSPRITWDLNGDAQPTIYYNRRATTEVPDDLVCVEQDWQVDGDTDYEAFIEEIGNARVCSITIYERQTGIITTDPSDPTSDNALHPPLYANGQMISDVAIQDVWSTLTSLKKRQGAQLAWWSVSDGSTSKSTTSATPVNIFDAGFSAWNANAPGWHVHPYRRGSVDSNSVPIVCAVFGMATALTTGEVEFRVNGSTIATVSGIDTIGWHTATGNLDASQTNQKIDALFSNDPGGGGNTTTVYAASVYQHTA